MGSRHLGETGMLRPRSTGKGEEKLALIRCEFPQSFPGASKPSANICIIIISQHNCFPVLFIEIRPFRREGMQHKRITSHFPLLSTPGGRPATQKENASQRFIWYQTSTPCLERWGTGANASGAPARMTAEALFPRPHAMFA
jgi:hypothetical protein